MISNSPSFELNGIGYNCSYQDGSVYMPDSGYCTVSIVGSLPDNSTFKIGAVSVSDLRCGDKEVVAAALGPTKIWSNSGGLIALGTGQTFDVAAILQEKGIDIDYRTLSVHDFFFSGIESTTRSQRVGWVSGSSSDTGHLTFKIEKSYDNTTGQLILRGVTDF